MSREVWVVWLARRRALLWLRRVAILSQNYKVSRNGWSPTIQSVKVIKYKSLLKRPRYGIKHVCWWPFAGFWISQDNRSATANYAESLMAAGRKRIILIGSPIPNPLTS